MGAAKRTAPAQPPCASNDCKRISRHIRWWDLTTSKPVAVLKGHNSVVRGLALLPDGATLISGGRDQVVLVWDLKRKKNVKTIAVLESVESVTYVPCRARFTHTHTHAHTHAHMHTHTLKL